MQGSFDSNKFHLQRQDIKTMIDRLDQLEVKYEFEQCCIDSAITMLEDLGNIVHRLKEENTSLKQELKDINKAIDDPAVDLTMTASECILKLKKENIKLKQEILQLEAIIDD